ncbi:MAG: DUF1622 domain-containing protein [Halanaerobiaceae bacterium]
MIHFLEGLTFNISHLLMAVLELMGGITLIYGAIMIFWHFVKLEYEKSSTLLRIRMARTIALALEFYLAAEILKTVFVRDMSELYIVVAIIVIRIAMGFVIHHELDVDFEQLQKEICDIEDIDELKE